MYIGPHVEDFYQILMKNEFLRQTFEKYLNMKFRENISSGSRVVPGGQTADIHDETNHRFSQFFERTYK
jgi:hypothetical protein